MPHSSSRRNEGVGQAATVHENDDGGDVEPRTSQTPPAKVGCLATCTMNCTISVALAGILCVKRCDIDGVTSTFAFFPPNPPTYKLNLQSSGKLTYNYRELAESQVHAEIASKFADLHIKATFLDTRSGPRVPILLFERPPEPPEAPSTEDSSILIYAHGNAADLGICLPFLHELRGELGVSTPLECAMALLRPRPPRAQPTQADVVTSFYPAPWPTSGVSAGSRVPWLRRLVEGRRWESHPRALCEGGDRVCRGCLRPRHWHPRVGSRKRPGGKRLVTARRKGSLGNPFLTPAPALGQVSPVSCVPLRPVDWERPCCGPREPAAGLPPPPQRALRSFSSFFVAERREPHHLDKSASLLKCARSVA